MAKHRIDRISGEVKRIISDIIRNDLNDPRISMLTSVVAAEVTPDLRYAKVFVSVLGDAQAGKDSLDALNRAAGFVRSEIGKRIRLRHVPEIVFKYDASLEKGAHISKLLREVETSTDRNDAGE